MSSLYDEIMGNASNDIVTFIKNRSADEYDDVSSKIENNKTVIQITSGDAKINIYVKDNSEYISILMNNMAEKDAKRIPTEDLGIMWSNIERYIENYIYENYLYTSVNSLI